jgi:hypothetical protein
MRRDRATRHDDRRSGAVADERDVLNSLLLHSGEARGRIKVQRQPSEAEEDELTGAHPGRGQSADLRPVQLDRQSLEARIREDDERPRVRRQRPRCGSPVVTLKRGPAEDHRQRPELDETRKRQKGNPCSCDCGRREHDR